MYLKTICLTGTLVSPGSVKALTHALTITYQINYIACSKSKKRGMYKYIHIRNIVCTHSVEKGGESAGIPHIIPKIRGSETTFRLHTCMASELSFFDLPWWWGYVLYILFRYFS